MQLPPSVDDMLLLHPGAAHWHRLHLSPPPAPPHAHSGPHSPCTCASFCLPAETGHRDSSVCCAPARLHVYTRGLCRAPLFRVASMQHSCYVDVKWRSPFWCVAQVVTAAAAQNVSQHELRCALSPIAQLRQPVCCTCTQSPDDASGAGGSLHMRPEQPTGLPCMHPEPPRLLQAAPRDAAPCDLSGQYARRPWEVALASSQVTHIGVDTLEFNCYHHQGMRSRSAGPSAAWAAQPALAPTGLCC